MVMKATRTTTYCDIDLDCGGYYYKGFAGTWETPPEEREFDIQFVELDGTDITELLDDNQIHDLERQILDEYY